MAILSVSLSGMDVFAKMAANSAKDLKAACNAGGEVAKTWISREAKSEGVWDTGETSTTPELKRATKKGDGYACYITWKGTHSGNPRRRAEVAFCQEYGTIHNPSRPFNQNAIQNHGDEIQDAIEKALPDY